MPEVLLSWTPWSVRIILSTGMNLYCQNGQTWQSRHRFICIPHTVKSGIYEELREVFGIPDKAEIALGNGSDELIQFLTMLVAKPDARVLGIEPSFVMYRHNAALYGMEYVGVPLNPDFSLISLLF